MTWKKVQLGDLCTIEKGKTGIQKAIPGEFPLVVTAEERKTHKEYQFDNEAVIIPLVSATGHGHASIKRIHFQTGKFALGSILCAVIPKKRSILNAEYLFRFLSFNKERELVDRMKGMANVTLSIKEIAKIEIPLPSLVDQIKIVEKYKLLENNSEKIFDELSDQLDLIEQLRQAFLREAMQGKLVNKIDTAETGQKLLAKIKAEKEKLILEKKIKKEKELPAVAKNQIPFELPHHWVWCRLGEICNYGSSPKAEPKHLNENTWVLDLEDIERGTSRLLCKIRFNERNSLSTKSIFKKGEVLYSKLRPYLDKVIVADEDGVCTTEILPLKIYGKINPYFLKNALKRSDFLLYVNSLTKGMKMPRLGTLDGKMALIPLPPVKEQDQIVAKLEELMNFCDGLEKNIRESQNYNDMLLQQVLREALQPQENVKTISIESRKIENPLKTILAGHIINLNNTADFGRVKFQKLLYLTEYICKINFDSHYIKKVAGPYDDALIKNIEADFNRMRFFNVVQEKTDNKRVRYYALPGASELKNLFLENFPDDAVRINNTILKFRPLSWGECELIATLYAVWNNRIIKNEPITDELLYSDFMQWDVQKKKYHSVFYKWLFWMKEESIIPDGWGKYIEKPNSK